MRLLNLDDEWTMFLGTIVFRHFWYFPKWMRMLLD